MLISCFTYIIKIVKCACMPKPHKLFNTKYTCWSIKAFRGLMMTPIADSGPIARGARNMQRDFPAPVAIRTNTSLPWTRGKRASSWPGRKLENLSSSRELLPICSSQHSQYWEHHTLPLLEGNYCNTDCCSCLHKYYSS